MIAALVPGERGPVEHKVDGREAHIQIVVQVGQGLIELVADFLALERVGGSEDSDLRHLGADIDDARLAFEIGAAFEVAGHLIRDDRDVLAEGFGREGNFHELAGAPVSPGAP